MAYRAVRQATACMRVCVYVYVSCKLVCTTNASLSVPVLATQLYNTCVVVVALVTNVDDVH